METYLSKLAPGDIEGLIFYVLCATTIEFVFWYFRKEVTAGLKGENGMWEAPEWIVYIAARIFPHMIFSSGFLKVIYPGEAWLLIGGLILFGLTGRWGLEWLLSLRTGVKPKTENNDNSPN